MHDASAEEIQQQLAALPPPQGIGDLTAKPVICAINGPVEGGGSEMALGCDFRFIAKDAYMGQPEVNAGIIPGGGGTQRLARLVGAARAMELCMSGRQIPADEAERIGLAVAACQPEDLMPTVMAKVTPSQEPKKDAADAAPGGPDEPAAAGAPQRTRLLLAFPLAPSASPEPVAAPPK